MCFIYNLSKEINWDRKDVHINQLVMGSEAPCCGSGLSGICLLILLHEKFLQFDWLRAVVLQLNLKYLHVKITNLVRVVV